MKTAEEKAADARQAAREMRAANYAQKQADGFECGLDTCSETTALLVVKLADGTRATRCQRHAGRATIEPYQWNESNSEREAA